MIVAKILKDHINTEHTRKNWEWHQNELGINVMAINFPSRLPFKLYDDDGELYYEGWICDDPECLIQFRLLQWAESDAGCTTIMVKRGREWLQEIG